MSCISPECSDSTYSRPHIPLQIARHVKITRMSHEGTINQASSIRSLGVLGGEQADRLPAPAEAGDANGHGSGLAKGSEEGEDSGARDGEPVLDQERALRSSKMTDRI